ncbi:MAG: hypothetical protein QW393_02510 [Candidatus Micrarchaeaceae archaeon]
MKYLEPPINGAVSSIRIVQVLGHPYSLVVEHRVKLLMIKLLVGESSRMFVSMLDVLQLCLE